MTIVTNLPMPGISTSREQEFARIPVDVNQTSFFEGREFRFVRSITAPIVFRFVAPVEFILSFQAFGITDGEFEFYAWRSDNVTASGTWTDEAVFSKNISLTRKLFNGSFYVGQSQIQSGGSIVVTDADLYSDFAHLKAATAGGQKQSIASQSVQGRYLAAGTYYLQFTGIADALYNIEWEERP
tara:strand:+ start:1172 stop:1723 length:552 start_codon:yes stop_codon:yes gene_type:complete